MYRRNLEHTERETLAFKEKERGRKETLKHCTVKVQKDSYFKGRIS